MSGNGRHRAELAQIGVVPGIQKILVAFSDAEKRVIVDEVRWVCGNPVTS
jgi:hypothetical protein